VGRTINAAALGRRGNTATQRLILAALESGGAMLQIEICAALGMHRNTVHRVLQRLHKSQVVFVESWVHPAESNTLTRSWAIRTSNDQCDAQRPKPKRRTDINRDYRHRHKAVLATWRSLKRGDAPNIWNGLLA
jgi:hypothetical protein